MRIVKLLWLIMFSTMVIAGVPGIGNAATTYMWFGGAGNWETAANWSPVHVPNDIANDYASVNSSGGAGSTCNINSNISVLVPFFGIDYGMNVNTPCTVNINSGATLTTGSELIISYNNNSYAVTNVYGTANLGSLRMAGNGNSNSKAVLNINGGTVAVTAFGTYIGCDFYGVSSGGVAQVNISNGGVFTISGSCFTNPSLPLQFGVNGSINIAGSGTLKVIGDVQTLLQGHIAAGKIAGVGLSVSYNAGDGYSYVTTTASITSTFPGNVRVQDDLRSRMILAVSYLDRASPAEIWGGFSTNMWGADWPGRTLEAYARTSLSLGYRSSSRFDEIGDGLLSRQAADGSFPNPPQANYYEKVAGLWFGNARGMMGLLWAYKYTNDSKYLTAAQKLGDYYMNYYFTVDPLSVHGSFSCVGTEAMVQLYKVSGNINHLNFAKRIADTVPAVNPISQHTHSYLLSLRGIVQIYEITGESKYLTMVLQQYAYFRDHIMWPGGGIIEHLGDPQSQLVDYWYDEGCSIADWTGLNMDLWRVTRNPVYMDMVERIALNHLLYDQDASGGFCGDRGVDFVRQGSPWPFCCAMHETRALSEVTEYIANADAGGNSVYVNLFYPSRTKLRLINDVNVVLATSYPLTGKVRVKLEMASPTAFTLKIRIPAWSSVKYKTLNGQSFSAAIDNHYLTIQRKWADKDLLDIEIDMPLRTEPRNAFVGNDQTTDMTKVSLWKGPRQLVYNQELNNHLWELKNARPALRYTYQIYENLHLDKSSQGTPLQIGSTNYSKGLGVHSVSECEYVLSGQFTKFQADIGVDECVGSSGSVRFSVCVDGVLTNGNVVAASIDPNGGTQSLYGFTVTAVTGNDQPKTIDVNVTGAQALRLCVDEAVDGALNDRADWANARLIRADNSVVYLSDLPDDRALGLPWNFGTVRLSEIDREKGKVVTLGYRVAEGLVPIKFNYLADLGYSLIGHRPVLNSYMKTTCPQFLAEDLNDDCVVNFKDIISIASNWLVDSDAR